MKLLHTLLAPALVAMMLVASPTASAFASELVTDVFDGVATTGTPGGAPIDIDPSQQTVRSADHAIGFLYTYKASGQASGDLAGPFTYEEHGYLFFTNPANPATFAGSRYDGGSFTLQSPLSPAGAVKIVDKNPAAYQAVSRTAELPQLDALLRSYGHDVVTRLGLISTPSQLGKRGLIHYGAFTFTDSAGTFWGVSTIDSRHFLMRLKFAADRTSAEPAKSVSSQGQDFNNNSRFPDFTNAGQR